MEMVPKTRGGNRKGTITSQDGEKSTINMERWLDSCFNMLNDISDCENTQIMPQEDCIIVFYSAYNNLLYPIWI